MTGAGVLGTMGKPNPLARETEALRLSPWRGPLTARYASATGVIAGSGAACAASDGDVSVVLHGRIDNLRALTAAYGTPPGDPGCLLIALWRAQGSDLARDLLGDFALLVLDHRRQRLLAARDWIGARPLFWSEHDGMVAVASEVKQVLALLDRPYRLDEATALDYVRLGEPDPEATFAVGVRAIPPSGQLIAHAGSPPALMRRPIRFEPLDLSPAEAARLVRERLDTAVERRLAGAARPAALISGGMDSTSVAATASYLAHTGRAAALVAGVSLHFPEVPQTDETRYARAVADRWHIPWHPVPIAPDELTADPSPLLALHDGPVFPGIHFFDRIFAEARAHGADVLLTGQGADLWQTQLDDEILFAILRREWRTALGWMTHRLRQHPRSTLRSLPRIARAARQSPHEGDHFAARGASSWTRLAYEVEERLASFHGMRMEAPFADRELAAALVGISPRLRSTYSLEKLPLREAMIDRLPESVRRRTDKSFFDPVFVAGFGAPGSGTIGQRAAAHALACWRVHLAAQTKEVPVMVVP